jgi:predicted HTH transcriptional regulator
MGLEDLIYDEEEEFERLVPKVKKVVMVKKTGDPVFVCDRNLLSTSEIIMVYLIGKFFAKKLGFVEEESATNDELHRSLKIKKNVLAARLNDLRKEGLVEQVARGKHKISTVKLEEFLDNVLQKIEGGA